MWLGFHWVLFSLHTICWEFYSYSRKNINLFEIRFIDSWESSHGFLLILISFCSSRLALDLGDISFSLRGAVILGVLYRVHLSLWFVKLHLIQVVLWVSRHSNVEIHTSLWYSSLWPGLMILLMCFQFGLLVLHWGFLHWCPIKVIGSWFSLV